MEQKSKNWMLLGLLGLAGFIVWKSSKAKAVPEFKDKEKSLDEQLGLAPAPAPQDPDFGKPLTEETLRSALVDPLTLGKTACTTCKFYRPDGNYYTKEALDNSPATISYLERYSKVSPHVDVRPVWNMNLNLSHLVKYFPTLESLSEQEFLNLTDSANILIDGKIVPKGHYVEYVLKPDPITLSPSIEEQLKIAAPLFDKPSTAVLSVIQSPSDPLKPVASEEYISKFDPDKVYERRRLGIDVGTTGVRQPQVTVSTTGTGYSDSRMVDGIMMGYPIEGAVVTQLIVANDGIGTVLYKNEYIMKSGVLTPMN